MMNEERDEILSLAGKLAGEQADADILEAMCDAAAGELEARLKEGLSPSELGGCFVTAAGVLALSLYCAVSPEHLKRFSAGDVSAEYGGVPDADGLRAMAETMLAGKLRERGFGFRGVQG